MKPNKIKEKVLKEVRNSGWSPELDVGMSYVEQAIDLTLAEVGKVIDGIDTEDFKHIKFKRPYFRGKEELKQKLGVTN